MKTAEEWAKEIAKDLAMDSAHIPAIATTITTAIKSIQLDAWKAGMNYAADALIAAGRLDPNLAKLLSTAAIEILFASKCLTEVPPKAK